MPSREKYSKGSDYGACHGSCSRLMDPMELDWTDFLIRMRFARERVSPKGRVTLSQLERIQASMIFRN
jgi:hypothetical protein